MCTRAHARVYVSRDRSRDREREGERRGEEKRGEEGRVLVSRLIRTLILWD